MATFTNQTTNLSTLSTTLGSLCRAFECQTRNAGISEETSRAAAEGFLDTLIERTEQVDNALMKSTEYLLPTLSGRNEVSRMTATELAQLLSSLHAFNAAKMQCVEKILAAETPRSNSEDGGKHQISDAHNTPYHWSLGLPLEKVIETDNETDRGSNGSFMKSPSVSNTPSNRSPGTPCTPSIAELRLSHELCHWDPSANTASILTKELVENGDSPEPAKSTSSSADVSFQTGNYWKRYMGNSDMSVDEVRSGEESSHNPDSAGLGKEDPIRPEKASFDRSLFGDRSGMSNPLYDTEEEADSIEEFTLCSTVVAEDLQDNLEPFQRVEIAEETEVNSCTEGRSTIISTVMAKRLKGQSEGSGEEDDEDDDVTTLCPTIIANSDDVEVKASKNIYFSQPSKFHDDINHVVLGSENSLSQTMLTMDATMYMNDQDVISQNSKIGYDALSIGEETPVLDRYRIDPDDNSAGFKVVPNQRGSSRYKVRPNSVDDQSSGYPASGQRINVAYVPKAVTFRDLTPTEKNYEKTYRNTPFRANSRVLPAAIGNDESIGPLQLEFPALPSYCSTTSAGDDLQESTSATMSTIRFDSEDLNSPARNKRRSFRKTPIPKNNAMAIDESAGEREAGMVHFESPLEYLTTPAKERKKLYRKTPHPKVENYDETSASSSQLRDHVIPAKKLNSRSSTAPLSKMNDDANSYNSLIRFSSNVRFDDESFTERATNETSEFPSGMKTPGESDKGFPDMSDWGKFGEFDRSQASVTCRSSNTKKIRGEPPSRRKPSSGNERCENAAENRSLVEYDIHDRLKSKMPNPLRSPLATISPASGISSTPQHIQIMNGEMITSPLSISSTLTGITGLTYTEKTRNLFPTERAKDGMLDTTGGPGTANSSSFMSRKSSSTLIPRITDAELAQALPVVKTQGSLDEVNGAINALNGAAFLTKDISRYPVLFTDVEAYKILRNFGFKRRRCKAMLMSLCHFRRLVMRQNADDPDGGHYFEVPKATVPLR